MVLNVSAVEPVGVMAIVALFCPPSIASLSDPTASILLFHCHSRALCLALRMPRRRSFMKRIAGDNMRQGIDSIMKRASFRSGAACNRQKSHGITTPMPRRFRPYKDCHMIGLPTEYPEFRNGGSPGATPRACDLEPAVYTTRGLRRLPLQGA